MQNRTIRAESQGRPRRLPFEIDCSQHTGGLQVLQLEKAVMRIRYFPTQWNGLFPLTDY